MVDLRLAAEETPLPSPTAQGRFRSNRGDGWPRLYVTKECQNTSKIGTNLFASPPTCLTFLQKEKVMIASDPARIVHNKRYRNIVSLLIYPFDPFSFPVRHHTDNNATYLLN